MVSSLGFCCLCTNCALRAFCMQLGTVPNSSAMVMQLVFPSSPQGKKLPYNGQIRRDSVNSLTVSGVGGAGLPTVQLGSSEPCCPLTVLCPALSPPFPSLHPPFLSLENPPQRKPHLEAH